MSARSAVARRGLAAEEGIALIVALTVMFVTSILLVAAFTSSEGEIRLTSTDVNSKKAFYAAQAGVNAYLQHLTQDSNYLTYCTEPTPANPALNQAGETTHRAVVPGTEAEPVREEYAIELLPANSAPANDAKCDPSNLVETMIEQSGTAAGSFRIESVGYAGGETRTLVATFKNVGFVSFVWFTKYETLDPVVYGEPYRSQCAAYYHSRPAYCANNFFTTGETVAGPLHTEDHAGVCGEPEFGRSASDRIEFGSREELTGEGFSTEGACPSATPKWVGTHILPEHVPELEPPPGDEELQHIVEPGYEFANKTEIVLNGETMSVTHAGKTESKAFPKNHLIYVSGGCKKSYSPFGPVPAYGEDSACGNVYVRGEYSQSLTIASQNDVVIDGSLIGPNTAGTPTGTSMLGLIANNFVRIYHPLSGSRGQRRGECGSSQNDATHDLDEPVIDAAVLALKHSIMVDNFDCGAANLGSLDAHGALAGLFSNGATGEFEEDGTLIHGYSWNLKYDTRLLAEEPPHFLNPVRAAWEIQRETLNARP